MKSAMNAAPIDLLIDNAEVGLVVPIPTLPAESIRILSVFAVESLILLEPTDVKDMSAFPDIAVSDVA